VYEIGQLVWLLKSDLSGLMNYPPVLILARYVAIPSVFPENEAMNEIMTKNEEKLVYDILCGGYVERRVDADWLSDYVANPDVTYRK
jgi:hypothetical protein